MPNLLSPELHWLALVTALTGLLWLPYIASIILALGPQEALSEGGGVDPQAGWAVRAKKAHANAVENLVVFAPLALMIHVLRLGDGLTAAAAMTFFYARLAHYPIYLFGLPYLRTIAFAVGFICQAVLALRLFGLV